MQILRNEIESVKDECIIFRFKPSEVDEMINEKIKFLPNFSELNLKIDTFTNKMIFHEEEANQNLKNQTRALREELEEKITKNH